MTIQSDLRAVYIDESQHELNHAGRLTNAGLACSAVAPKRTVDEMLEVLQELRRDGGLDVVLLDYRLDDRPGDRVAEVNYRGGTIAAALRELLPHVPLVLVTTAEKFGESLAHNRRVRGLFDLMILKERLATSLEQRQLVAKEVEDLALGYRNISQQTQGTSADTHANGWEILASIMNATSTQKEDLAASHAGEPPFETAEVAEWLLRGVLRYPGFLLNDRETAVRLGITQGSFVLAELQRWLQPSRFSGAFSQLNVRWWRDGIGSLLLDAAGPDSTGGARRRTQAIAAVTGIQELQADKCVWCGDDLINRACHLCGQAVDPSHRLVANVDERPEWAEPAVVCFRCIADGTAGGIRFGAGTEDIVAGLTDGEITPPSAQQ